MRIHIIEINHLELSSLGLLTVGATAACVAGGETITDVVGAGESAVTGSNDTSKQKFILYIKTITHEWNTNWKHK